MVPLLSRRIKRRPLPTSMMAPRLTGTPVSNCRPPAPPILAVTLELHSIVDLGAAANTNTTLDSVSNDWFTTRKKQVFVDSGIQIFFIGSGMLTRLVSDGSVDAVCKALERSDPEWRSVDSVDTQGTDSAALGYRAHGRIWFRVDCRVVVNSGRVDQEVVGSSWGLLHHVATSRYLEVMRLLLLNGTGVDAKTSDGHTTLHLAAGELKRDWARILLASGARMDVRGEANGDMPMYIAVSCGDKQMVWLLLAKGCAGTREARNQVGHTMYDTATEEGHGQLFNMLRLGDGLCAMARKGERRGVGKLVDRGAGVNMRDQNG
ncbi:hypothetical protein J5N97_009824 [Dioscorea zingiberensis]|uniref:Uncharacterized protein n=1 Tax=Dioscorea zingiberensis TaxID=325984 RepID=A0A9D5CYY3_9LILI|nr:hypothetical protein J5N97_009824 [Dioscorea zingiberensis]